MSTDHNLTDVPTTALLRELSGRFSGGMVFASVAPAGAPSEAVLLHMAGPPMVWMGLAAGVAQLGQKAVMSLDPFKPD